MDQCANEGLRGCQGYHLSSPLLQKEMDDMARSTNLADDKFKSRRMSEAAQVGYL